MASPRLGYSFDDRRRAHSVGCAYHVRRRSMLVSPSTHSNYIHQHPHLQHPPILSTMANGSERPLGASFHAAILDVRGSIAIPGVHNCTASPVQTPSSMGHTFECCLLRSDSQPAGSCSSRGHLGRQPQSLRRIAGFTDWFGQSVERPSIARPRFSLETLLGRHLEEWFCLRSPSRDVACN